ncbi:MAG: DNA polymerase III subunit delta, partial [Chromatiaceae bacterium]
HRVPRMRQDAVERALRRLAPDLLQDLLAQCAEADLAIKGLAPRDSWHQLATIADALASGPSGFPLLSH